MLLSAMSRRCAKVILPAFGVAVATKGRRVLQIKSCVLDNLSLCEGRKRDLSVSEIKGVNTVRIDVGCDVVRDWNLNARW